MERVTKINRTRNERIIGTRKVATLVESTGKEVEVLWTCEAMGGTLRRKEGDGNGSTIEDEEEERNA